MHDIMAVTKAGKFTAKLWTSVAVNGGWPAEKVEPRSKNSNYSVGRKRTVERVSAPVIHADEIILVSIVEKIQPNMLHGEAEMS